MPLGTLPPPRHACAAKSRAYCNHALPTRRAETRGKAREEDGLLLKQSDLFIRSLRDSRSCSYLIHEFSAESPSFIMEFSLARLAAFIGLLLGASVLYVSVSVVIALKRAQEMSGKGPVHLMDRPVADKSSSMIRPSASSCTDSSSIRWPDIPAPCWPRSPMATNSTTRTRAIAISSSGACTRNMVRSNGQKSQSDVNCS